MDILIAGGSGFVGKHLEQFLTTKGHNITILTRSEKKARQSKNGLLWDGKSLETRQSFDLIINLCGLNIAEKKWSKAVKQQLIDSRIYPTQAIVRFIENYPSNQKPTLLNASAIGFYHSSDAKQTEQDYEQSHKPLFSTGLVSQWESCAQSARQFGAKVSCLRFGVVLGHNGGMLKKVMPSFNLGLGAIIGDKKAHLSWVHIQDVCRAVEFIMQQPEPKKAYNITSVQSCTQETFSKTLASALKKPCFIHLPSFFVKLMFGQMGEELLLANQKIYPKNLIDGGFEFRYESINEALNEIMTSA